MAILNVTPDSFSDGGQFNCLDLALGHVQKLVSEGADIIDVGGESTRPGSMSVSVQEELDRVIPVIEKIKQNYDIEISIDTSKPEVMSEAVGVGAMMINDVNALEAEGAVEQAKLLGVKVCLMHKQGDTQTMQDKPIYDNIVDDVYCYLENRVSVCQKAGISKDKLIIDPGFGFGKTLEHNLKLLKHIDFFKHDKIKVLVGLSRKSMLGLILGAPVNQRLYGSLGAAAIAVWQGVDYLRVHDVKETCDVVKICEAIKYA